MKPSRSENQIHPIPGSVSHDDVQDLVEAMKRLTDDGDGVLPRLIKQVELSNQFSMTSNLIAERNRKTLRLSIYGLLLCLILAGIDALFINHVVNKVADLQESLQSTQNELSTLKRTSESTHETVEAVKANTESIAVEQSSKPQYEIVPETDPKKARQTPVKVRINTPKTKAVEIPVHLNDARVVPSTSAVPSSSSVPSKP